MNTNRANGLQIPVEVMDGKILDGRRRWKACEMAGVEPDILEVDVEDPVAYVLSLNLHRRHLTTSQASMCAQRARKMYDEAAKKRQKEHGSTAPGRKKNTCGEFSTSVEDDDSGKSRDQVGEAFGVSGYSVDRAKKVIGDGIPELAEAVDQGKVTVSRAADIAGNPKGEQKQLLELAMTRTRIEKVASGETKRAEGRSGVVGTPTRFCKSSYRPAAMALV